MRTPPPYRPPRSMTKSQIRARARRADALPNLQEQEILLGKAVDDWDLEELARGRPRNAQGTFAGRPPTYINREIHEKAMNRFKDMVRTDMRSHTAVALKVLKDILEDNDVDNRGRPTTPPSVKVDVAKFLIEHLVGKPTQPIEADINIKLQGILGAVLVQPGQEGFVPSSSHREIVAGEVVEDD